jgi:hypothetical protein
MSNLLTRLRELSGKATKGPWETTDDGCYLTSSTEYDVSEICEMTLSNHPDSELIALMRNNIDKLLDVVEAARKIAVKTNDGPLDFPTHAKSWNELVEALQALERET